MSIFLRIAILFLFGCTADSPSALSQEDFMIPENLYGTWKVVGFQDAYYITNEKDEKYIEKWMGKEISFGKQFRDGLERSKNYGYDLKSSYETCDLSRSYDNCDRATIFAMDFGKISKIVRFHACDPQTYPQRCFFAYGISMYVFENGDVKFFIHPDGGFFVVEKK